MSSKENRELSPLKDAKTEQPPNLLGFFPKTFKCV